MAELFSVPPQWNQLINDFKPQATQTFYPWYQKNKRELPWRSTTDPYAIWVSEIMLQQSRVNQVLSYFHAFMNHFPTLDTLANASIDRVLKVWEGLGYYRRAHNLHKSAKIIQSQYQGKFPKNHQKIAALPGIGEYTAAAIASIAFGMPYAVVDGNVIRVIARLFHISDFIDKQPGKRKVQWCADSLLEKDHPGMHNQAMMELGAMICQPAHPHCSNCPLQSICLSYQEKTSQEILALPKKTPKKAVPHYDIATGLVWNQGKLLIALRPEHGMLGGLWEFPGGKLESNETLEECCVREIKEEMVIDVRVERPFIRIKHAYSHFKITMTVFHCTYLRGIPGGDNDSVEWRWVYPEELPTYPFPKANSRVIDALLGTGSEQDLLFS